MVEISRKSASRNDRFSPIDQNQKLNRNKPPSFSSRYTNELMKPKPNQFSEKFYDINRYTKKLPISFVSAKDWRLYVHFSNKIRSKTRCKPRGRVERWLTSFIRLYKEYAFVCDNLLACQTTKIDNSNRSIDGGRFVLSNRASVDSEREQSETRNICEDFQRSFDVLNYQRFSGITIYDNQYKNGHFKRWFLNSLRFFRSRKSFDTVPYDKITPDQHETIEIYSNEKMQNLVSHRISFTGFDHVGHPMIKWIQVPIALELLIPKVQTKIQRIMNSCSFLYDPLEVVAELRYFNYNVDMCISHFHRTRKFRDILQNCLPQKSQLKDLENHPQLWWKFQSFLEKLGNEQGISSDSNKSYLYDSNAANNYTNCNPVLFHQRDSIAKKNLQNFSTENLKSVMQTKLILITCCIEKVKLSRGDIQETLNKWKGKYSKQMIEYSNMIIHIIESFKDFLMTEEQRGRVLHLMKQNDELKLKLKDEEQKRKTIYNMMQDQLGNVRVYCRCRALDRNQSVLDIKANDTIMVQIGFCEEYKFDKVFEPFRSQQDIYDELQPLIMSFIDGFNVCFITYGGEASGKTYTLLGPVLTSVGLKDVKKHDGIMKRALEEVLSEESSRQRDWEYHLTGSIVEIYNDAYTDLLGEKTGIHLPIDGGLEKIQETLKTISIDKESDIETLIKVCKIKRKIGKTALNPHSSRSHLITIIHLTGRSRIHGETISSFMGMCDLAGFEDILKAETQNNHVLSKEAGYINKSLTAFNRMFTSLRRQDPNSVSYRDTRLTYLLKPFLTNQGKCVLIVTVRTDKLSISSTQSTLRFGRESRGVSLGKAKRQTNLDTYFK